ncbi:hypothetical protein MM221_14770 [Salipaludibacillus sp. LMS25]|jgi:hypothetical protein|uniref:hypothetical protein n=1 Tax=Salipaludibacillus sp. LMS25 TaxID=2924031 RepID=UPI0020D0EB05|nr:hypothetical protein [Salipaludibacillus sp. LMS25]UTR13863.1 hypothetical protein MM221_14770 [Salipaludibacillus sp. LMS25]
MSKKDKKPDNQFKENANNGEHRPGRLSQYKNSPVEEAGFEYEYMTRKNKRNN